MRHAAVVIAAALVFAMIAPAAFAQPFADVPTNHWAYDAIAELAAKGLVEGYPDGTFKGDRAMTRYEMAMVVARILARIESIQIPAPAPAPEVTRANLEALQRLVNEFRAELAALGVRVTALEEELNAIKAKLDNVKITGAWRLRWDSYNTAVGTNINPGNPNATNTAGNGYSTFRPRMGYKVQFDGSVADNVHVILQLLAGNGNCSPNTLGGANCAVLGTSTPVTFNSSAYGITSTAGNQYTLAAVDQMFFDWKNAFGWPLEFWLGRFGGNGMGWGQRPIVFGPFGLLMNTADSAWQDSTSDTHSNSVDGLAMFWNSPSLADLKLQALITRVAGGNGTTSYQSGEDAWGVDANIRLIPGLRIGAYYVGNQVTAPVALIPPAVSGIHFYGPAGGTYNPGVPGGDCAAFGNGIACSGIGSGWAGYVGWDIFPGIHFDGEYATWNPTSEFGSPAISDNGWQVNVIWDLGTLLGVGHSLQVQTGYNSFGINFVPPYGGGADDFVGPSSNVLYPGNVQGFLGVLSFVPVTNWKVYLNYYGGNTISNGLNVTEWEAGLQYLGLAPNTKVSLLAHNNTYASITQVQWYRVQIDYTF